MTYEPLTVKDDNFQPYRVSVPRLDPKLVKAVHDIIEEARKLSRKPKPEKLYAGQGTLELPNIHFDRHLYQPLLIAKKGGEIKCSPPALNEGERQFVEDLRSFCKREAAGILKGKELFLLRNLSRGKGIGFFEARGFYPDFVLWIKSGKRQRIIFVEPHGMLHEQGGTENDKLKLHLALRKTSAKALKGTGLKPTDLDAFVVSRTPYDELRKNFYHKPGDFFTRDDFTEHHVLFQEGDEAYDYIEEIVRG